MMAQSLSNLEWFPLAALLLLLSGVLLLAYLKIGVVLAVLRRGLGGIPPASLTALLALLLSGLAMAPLCERCQKAWLGAHSSKDAQATVFTRLQAGTAPLREFLLKHTPVREQMSVQELARQLDKAAAAAPIEQPGIFTLLVAFALSELRVAFQIAFLLLLPFLLIDLLCASLLSGLLMPGLSARAVALPFKLLLFVACDGWQVLARGLLSAYGAATGGGGGP